MTDGCHYEGCTVADTGRCALERDPATCSNRFGNEGTATEAATPAGDDVGDTAGSPVLTAPAEMPSFPPSTTLGLEAIQTMMASRYVTVVGILGDPESGKTACLASLYLLVSNALLDGWSFADSRSLMAFEEIARGARRWNEGHPPEQMTVHTEMADDRQPGFLHLRLRNDTDERHVDLALPDLPGEWTKTLIRSARSPSGATALFSQPDPHGALHELLPAIADGLASHFGPAAEHALQTAAPETLGGLALASPTLATSLVNTPALVQRLGDAIPEMPPNYLGALQSSLLPLLVRDEQIEAAKPLIAYLDTEALLSEVRHLNDTVGLAASAFVPPLVQRAGELGATTELREQLLGFPISPGRDRFLMATLSATAEDILWLLNHPGLRRDEVDPLVLELLRRSDSEQLALVFGQSSLADAILSRITDGALDVLLRVVRESTLQIDAYLTAVLRLLPSLSGSEATHLAGQALDRSLVETFQGDEVATIDRLLDVAGTALDMRNLVSVALARNLPPRVVSRNLIALDHAPTTVRHGVVKAIEYVAEALANHYQIGLDADGANACAHLFSDAQSLDERAHLRAAGRLLPILMRSRNAPVSAMIAATFPAIYRELAKEDDVPDMLKFVPFFDWDRCKAARRELVDGFLSSTVWSPADLVLTACRSSDVSKILKRTAKAYGGEAYIDRMSAQLAQLPAGCRDQAQRAINRIRADWAARYDWRD